MRALRRIFAHHPRTAVTRWSHTKALALLVVVVIPGGLVLPIFYGIYGAIRHTLSPKGVSRTAPAPAEEPAAVTLERDAPL